jgi:peptide-methionine (S)-S-oxide reductase
LRGGAAVDLQPAVPRRVSLDMSKFLLVKLSIVVLGLVAVLAWAGRAEALKRAYVLPPAPEAELAPAEGQDSASIILGGGCFWCSELVFENVRGVTDVVSGYAGGSEENAVYEKVANHQTEHVEVIKVTYDPGEVTLGELLRVFFLTHYPTQAGGQGPDIGEQYRSAIFYDGDAQKQAVDTYLTQLKGSGAWDEPIVTDVMELPAFYDAEAYHQDFVEKNPRNAYVVRYALPKLEVLKAKLPEMVASEAAE